MKTFKIQKKPALMLFTVALTLFSSCSKDGSGDNTDATAGKTDNSSCENPVDVVFNEENGLLNVEFEAAKFSADWKLKSNGNNFSGKGYMVWEGAQYLHEPGNGVATFKLKIKNSGTYRFIWKSAVKKGSSGTDHNDTWLRFNDAASFYAKKGSSKVYPKDSGKTPNPAGASKDGWFKIYRSGDDLDFKWNSLTYDNNGHEVFVDFNSSGTYTMEISARSSGHGIDKFVLFNKSVSQEEATTSTETSSISCSED